LAAAQCLKKSALVGVRVAVEGTEATRNVGKSKLQCTVLISTHAPKIKVE
jgi:hypothetical protein